MVESLGKRLPFTGLPLLLVGLIGGLALLVGVTGRFALRPGASPPAGDRAGADSPPASGPDTGEGAALAPHGVATAGAASRSRQADTSLERRLRLTGVSLLLVGLISALLVLNLVAGHDRYR